jgi:hypothetical protein
MTPLRSILLLILLVAGTVACAAPPGSGERRDPLRISREEIQGAHYGNAYELIRAQRPQWLRVRGGVGFSGPAELVVYVDNIRFGEVDSLQTVTTSDVEFMERVDANTATQRWGTGHAGGVIYIQTRRIQ